MEDLINSFPAPDTAKKAALELVNRLDHGMWEWYEGASSVEGSIFIEFKTYQHRIYIEVLPDGSIEVETCDLFFQRIKIERFEKAADFSL